MIKNESKSTDISVVIVNYKVKEYISNLLSSLYKAKGDYRLQIFVVDNKSDDGSIEYLESRYPDVVYIKNEENLGFGIANNQAIRLAEGEFTLIINPDTLVSEDTLEIMVQHMRSNPKCGASGCKILNPDGTYAPESKRSIPTISTAISKVLGLNTIFPKSKVFGSYYLGWIDENETSKIEVLSGSFMFWRTDLLKEMQGFDERFFMYGEDIDLCYRIQNTEFHIEYVPSTSIIHYKGESTRKGDLKYVRIFNQALFQFFDKHHSKNYSRIFRSLVFTAIWARILISFIVNNIRSLASLTTDLALLNISVVLGFLIRFNFSFEVLTNIQSLKYLWINVLASLFYILIGSVFNLFRNRKTSISNTLKAVFGSYVGIALLTFFVRNLAFSRLALIYGLTVAIIIFLVNRLIQINTSNSGNKVTGRLKSSKILLVGSETYAKPIIQQIYSRPDWNYEVIGTVSVDESDGDYVGSLPQLSDLIRAYNVDQVFFLLNSISYKSMLQHITKLQDERAILKLIPDSMDFILGKSNVEYLEQIPVVDIDVPYTKELNLWLKRLVDIVISLPIVFLGSPMLIYALFKMRKNEIKVGKVRLLDPILKHKNLNKLLLAWNTLLGRLQIVGSTLSYNSQTTYSVKPGIVGYVQINQKRIQNNLDLDNYLLYYVQNYSLWLDIDIIMKSFFSDYSVLESLERELKK